MKGYKRRSIRSKGRETMRRRIDRVSTSAPGWILQTLHVYAYIEAPPGRMFNAGLSDHMVVAVVLQRRAAQARALRRRPQPVHGSAKFAEVLCALEARADWSVLSPFAALAHHHELMEEVARVAQELMEQVARRRARREGRPLRRWLALSGRRTVHQIGRRARLLHSSCGGQIH